MQGIFDEPLTSHYGPQGCCILSKQFYETDLSRGFVRGYNMQVTRGPGPVNDWRATGLARGTIPWGAGHHEAFARCYDRTVNIGICCEDLPEEHNAVTLDPDAHRRGRHSGAEDHLSAEREHAAHAAARRSTAAPR